MNIMDIARAPREKRLEVFNELFKRGKISILVHLAGYLWKLEPKL